MNFDQIEIEERQALLADIERRIIEQQRLLETYRAAGQPMHRAAFVLVELHHQADRLRDYLRIMRESVVVVAP